MAEWGQAKNLRLSRILIRTGLVWPNKDVSGGEKSNMNSFYLFYRADEIETVETRRQFLKKLFMIMSRSGGFKRKDEGHILNIKYSAGNSGWHDKSQRIKES